VFFEVIPPLLTLISVSTAVKMAEPDMEEEDLFADLYDLNFKCPNPPTPP
jgi:hypothetical protein